MLSFEKWFCSLDRGDQMRSMSIQYLFYRAPQLLTVAMALHFNVNLSCKHRSTLCDNADIVVPILIFFASSIKLQEAIWHTIQWYLILHSASASVPVSSLPKRHAVILLFALPTTWSTCVRSSTSIVGWVSLTTGSPSVVAMRTEVPVSSIFYRAYEPTLRESITQVYLLLVSVGNIKHSQRSFAAELFFRFQSHSLHSSLILFLHSSLILFLLCLKLVSGYLIKVIALSRHCLVHILRRATNSFLSYLMAMAYSLYRAAARHSSNVQCRYSRVHPGGLFFLFYINICGCVSVYRTAAHLVGSRVVECLKMCGTSSVSEYRPLFSL